MEGNTETYYKEYYRNLSKLVNLFHTDPNFSVEITGDGFNGLGIDMPTDEMQAAQQVVLFVHKQTLVLPTSNLDYDSNHPLLLYIERSRPGACKLWMSSRTHSLMMKEDYGIPLKECINVHMDKDNMPKFFLDNHTLSQKFQDQLGWNLVLLKSVDVQEPPSPNEIYCVKRMLAFHCPVLPNCAQKWMHRNRKSKWPSQNLVQQASKNGCHLLTGGNYPGASSTVATEWIFCFADIEKQLFEDLSFPKKKTYGSLLRMLSTLREWHDELSKYHLQTVFLWSLENMSPESFQTDDSTTIGNEVLHQLLRFLSQKNCPHFFQSDVNLFECVKQASLELLQGKVRKLLDENSMTDGDRHTDDGIATVNWKYFVHLFEQNIHLMVMEMHARLHNCESVDKSITKHKAVLKAVDNLVPEEYGGTLEPLKKALNGSLGSAYFAKGIQAFYAKEKRVYFRKAEECLQSGIYMDRTLGIARLAGFYVKTKQFERALETLSKLIFKKIVDEEVEEPATCTVSETKFTQELWSKWMSGCFEFVFVVSQLEKQNHLASVQKNLRLAATQMFGLLRLPVYTVNPHYLGRYLYIISCVEVGCTNGALFNQLLNDMESQAEIDQADLNDKRSLMYYNLLAHLHLVLGDKGKAVSLLKKSARMMSNSSNPANFQLLNMRTEWLKKAIVRSVGVAAAAGLAILIFKLRS